MTPAGGIVICGAGIAGLTVALALARKGIASTIIEREAQLDGAGAGIQLSANATRVLDRLGVAGLRDVAYHPQAVSIRAARTLGEIGRVPLGAQGAARWGAPYLTLARADLQRLLLEAVIAEGVRVETGVEACGFTGDRLTVKRDGLERQMEAGLVIGSDGVWSPLRAAVSGVPARFSGQVAWRAIVDDGARIAMLLDVMASSENVITFAHRGFHLVCYPLGANRINLVAITKGGPMAHGWRQAGDSGLLETRLAGAHAQLREAISEVAAWTAWPIHEVDASGPWRAGKLVLIGDSAHAMSPHAAQGAAMAIEDAACLAGMLARSTDVPEALAAYETERRARIGRVAARGKLNRFAWHASGPIALARNAVFRLKGPGGLAADLDWLYGDRGVGAYPPR